ncbi:MAG: di-heme oxidoredictase family protein [Burkholderiaceae bacterium]
MFRHFKPGAMALILLCAIAAAGAAAQINDSARDRSAADQRRDTGKGGARVYKKRSKLPPSAATQALLQRAGRSAGPQFGDPLADLDASSRAAFDEGLAEFIAVETPEGGLGPIFNNNACAACHTAGGIGGASDLKVTRFGRRVNGQFDEMAALGGSLLQSQAIHPGALESVPPEANVIAQRVTTPLFGLGLIDAVADETIELNAQRRQADGVKGRVARVLDVTSGKLRVGRFGWKAQQASLLAFSGDAYLNEMGVTSRLFPFENAPNGRADLLDRFDLVADVEDAIDPVSGKSDIDHAADFMRFLAPPPQLRKDAAALASERIFARAECSACHTPVLTTAPNAVAALSNKTLHLYSDLLLHDMGKLGDGIAQGTASQTEMRTAPLWGLRARTTLLHDGRAATARAAIELHDGEASASRLRFGALSAAEQSQLLAFLQTI